MCQTMQNAFKVTFLGKVVLQAMAATAGYVLISFAGGLVDDLYVIGIVALKRTMGEQELLQASVGFN